VIRYLLNLTAWGVMAGLMLFTLRRWLFIFFALKPAQPEPVALQPEPEAWPSVLLLVPVRNEASGLPALLATLHTLAYPTDRLTVVLIDDGSSDGSKALIQTWSGQYPSWQALFLAENVGKAEALNLALDHFPQGEIVAIYDADERPQPEALVRLIACFADRRVGAVSGRRAVSNALATPAASYTAFEGLVHQLVTMAAKDRLDLAPAILGANCAYRRQALQQVGGFKAGALLEDSDLSLKLVRAGWRLRFCPEAVSYHQVPQTVTGYWRQHTRWARGFNDVARDQAPNLIFDQALAWPLRLELLIFSLGYLDRVALLAGFILLLLNKQQRRWLGPALLLNLITPLLQIMAALQLGRQPLALWRQMAWIPLFFGLDVAMAVTGLWTTLLSRPQAWEERGLRQ
jgi:cellulose synthase/poly-beta-1,6-N-acetylglucosamine synthase-like glycosyltransferase